MARAEIKTTISHGGYGSGTNIVTTWIEQNFVSLDTVVQNHTGVGYPNTGWKHGPVGEKTGVQFKVYPDDKHIKRDIDGGWRWIEEDTPVDQHIDYSYSEVDKKGNRYLVNKLRDPEETDLIVVIYRNPLSWILSLYEKPHHALEIYNIKDKQKDYTIVDFLNTPWRTYASPPRMEDATVAEREKWIEYGELLEDQSSPLAHRAESLRNLGSTHLTAPNVVYAPFEWIKSNPAEKIDQIAQIYGISVKHPMEITNQYKGLTGKIFTGENKPPLLASTLNTLIENAFDPEYREGELQAGYSLSDLPQRFTEEQLMQPGRLVTVSNPRFYRDFELIS